MFSYISIFVVGLLIIAVILFLFRNRGSGSVSIVGKIGSENIPVRNTEAGALIRDYLRIAFSGGDVTDASEEATIERMRQHSSAVLDELTHVYSTIAQEAYDARWGIVYCASRLKDPTALTFLREVVTSSIPPERSRNIHLHSTVAEETTIRMRALEGVRLLAADGHDDAQKLLFNFLQLPSLSLRIAASQALITLPGGENHRSRIEEQLRASEQGFLRLRPAEATDFEVRNPPFGDLAPALDRAIVNPHPPLAQDAQASGQPNIPARPDSKGRPLVP